VFEPVRTDVMLSDVCNLLFNFRFVVLLRSGELSINSASVVGHCCNLGFVLSVQAN
jgi:hypothetical protein